MTTTANLALWLADHTDSIACDEAAGDCYREIRNAVEAIERMINRPIPHKFLGPCPHPVTDHRHCRRDDGKQCTHNHTCATQLTADKKADEVECPACRTLYRVSDLIETMRNELAYHPFTATQLLGRRTSELPGILEELEEPVPRSTLYKWIKRNRLLPCGYLSVKGVFSITRERDTDEHAYYLADVRKLRNGEDMEERAS